MVVSGLWKGVPSQTQKGKIKIVTTHFWTHFLYPKKNKFTRGKKKSHKASRIEIGHIL